MSSISTLADFNKPTRYFIEELQKSGEKSHFNQEAPYLLRFEKYKPALYIKE